MYWTLELAYHLDDAPWPATKDELIDYAIHSCAPLEVVEHWKSLKMNCTNVSKMYGQIILQRKISCGMKMNID